MITQYSVNTSLGLGDDGYPLYVLGMLLTSTYRTTVSQNW